MSRHWSKRLWRMVKTNMAPLRGWAPKGERLPGAAPFGHWNTSTFIAALRHDRIDAPWVFDGPVNGDIFRTYVERVLAPTLRPGDVVVMDNLGSHKSQAVRQAIRSAGAHLGLLDPVVQRLGRAADLRRDRHDRLPTRRILTLVVENQPHGPLAHLRGKLVRGLAHDAPSYSRVGASGKPGAVQKSFGPHASARRSAQPRRESGSAIRSTVLRARTS